VVLRPEESKQDADKPAVLADYSEATLPGHLHGDDEGAEGYSAGDVLPGDAPIAQALAELKQPGAVARAAAARQAKPKAKPAAAPASARKPAAPAASAPQQSPAESGKTTEPSKSEPALPPSGS